MTWCDFDEDLRFCTDCERYVRYLLSPANAYCTECGGVVRIYSPEDMTELKRANRDERFLVNRLGIGGGGGHDPRAVS